MIKDILVSAQVNVNGLFAKVLQRFHNVLFAASQHDGVLGDVGYGDAVDI